MRAHSECNGQFPIAKIFTGCFVLIMPAFLRTSGLIWFRRAPPGPQAHDIEFLAEDAGEAALRHASVQRHLAAFKSAWIMREPVRELPLCPRVEVFPMPEPGRVLRARFVVAFFGA